jgi:hypothetical protein
MSPTPRLPEDLRARVLAEARRAPAPTRSEHRARIVVMTAAGALATTILFFAFGGFARGERPAELVSFVAGSGLLAAIALTYVSAGAGGSMLGRSRPVLVLVCAVAAPALALVAFAAAACWPAVTAEEVGPSTHLTCALLTLLQAAVPLIVLIVPKRGSDPVHPALMGGTLGMTAGAWAATMAYLRCPHGAALHCMLAHVVPTLVLTAAGALVGRALLKIR